MFTSGFKLRVDSMVSRVHGQGFLKPCPFLMQCCPKLRPCTQRLNLLMILSTVDIDSSFTFYAVENLKLLHRLFLRVFLKSNTFPAPCCPDPSSWNVLLPSNSTWAYLFFNEIKYLSLDISCFLCSTVIFEYEIVRSTIFLAHTHAHDPKIFGTEVVETLFTTPACLPCVLPLFSATFRCVQTQTQAVFDHDEGEPQSSVTISTSCDAKFQNCEGLCPDSCLILSPLQTPGKPTASIHSCYISELCPFKRLVTRNVPKI